MLAGRFWGPKCRGLPPYLYAHVSRHKNRAFQGSSARLNHSRTQLLVLHPQPRARYSECLSLIPGNANLSWLSSYSPHSHYPASHRHQMDPFFWTIIFPPKKPSSF